MTISSSAHLGAEDNNLNYDPKNFKKTIRNH